MHNPGEMEPRAIFELTLPDGEKLLQGRNAIVTGGAQSIGKTIVEALLRNGARVAIFDINESKLQKTVVELSPLGQVKGNIVDIRKADQIIKSVDEVERDFGFVDTLVNCAGVMAAYPLSDFHAREIERIIDTNLKGSLFCTKIVGSRMAEKNIAGSIINITSNHAVIGFPHAFPYAASKAGLVGATRSLAAELGRYGIRVNALSPGATYPTGMTNEVTDEMIAAIPLGRVFHPNEIANIVVFLASDMSSAITGAHILADGGQSSSAPFSQPSQTQQK